MYKTLGDDVDLSKIAHTTIGFTGADLENLLNEAAIACAKDGRSFISQEDVDKSFIKLGIGKEKKSRIVSEHDRKITAYHEAGHAILFHVLPDVGPVHIVSIIPTGSGAGGYFREGRYVFDQGQDAAGYYGQSRWPDRRVTCVG